MQMNERLSTSSDTMAMSTQFITDMTVYGMESRFAWIVLNPRDLNDSCR